MLDLLTRAFSQLRNEIRYFFATLSRERKLLRNNDAERTMLTPTLFLRFIKARVTDEY